MRYSTKTIEEEEIAIGSDLGSQLVLFNDDFNTFEWVIHCLIKYCEHLPEQAEQCAWIVHTKGKCVVKKGAHSELLNICAALLQCGLTAKVIQ
jgi:ATP-dependent Clp protease adaptor protein ClpS